MRVRTNVWDLTDDTLKWYEAAIGVMRARPITDPTSWRFQAAIHDYTRSRDPYKVTGESMPSSTVQDTYWKQCQHSCWFFLPWHRMYLHYFEQIVAAAVVEAGGPAGWTLPYWNYSGDASTRLLPPAFRSPTKADGSVNNLYVAQRRTAANGGTAFATAGQASYTAAFTEIEFSAPLGDADAGFGGSQTAFDHGDFGTVGALEATPHGSMHVAVGGPGGFMSSFDTAGLDPIFWLHHCNIDRLWAAWLRQGAGREDPQVNAWLTAVSFPFYDEGKNPTKMTASQVVNTADLGYRYDDEPTPKLVVPPLALAFTPPGPGPLATFLGAIHPSLTKAVKKVSPRLSTEVVGATSDAFTLHGTTHQKVATPVTKAARSRRAAIIATAPRVLLHLENIRAKGHASAYDVYINLPTGAKAADHPELFAGHISLFGVTESSKPRPNHPGSGLSYVLDITALYGTLGAGEDLGELRVSFVPVDDTPGAKVTVGRVSVNFG